MSTTLPAPALDHAPLTVARVTEQLREAIYAGELPGGSPLREVALTERFGVSRPTVREVLASLVAEGLAVREPHRGATVARPDPDTVADVCRAHRVLAIAGVRRWRDASPAAREAVQQTLAGYRGAIQDELAYEFLHDRHLAVHTAFVGLLESPRLASVADSLGVPLRLAMAQTPQARRLSRDTPRAVRLAKVHADAYAKVLAALERGRIERAATLLEHHLAEAAVEIEDALRR